MEGGREKAGEEEEDVEEGSVTGDWGRIEGKEEIYWLGCWVDHSVES